MATWTLLDIANFLYRWSSPFFVLVSLVFGILILFGKNKNLKILGLGVVLGIGNTLASYINGLLPNLYNTGVLNEDFYRSGNSTDVKMILGLTAFSFGLVATVLRWLYTKRSYGTRIGVLIAIIMLMVTGPVARVMLNRLMTGGIRNESDANWYAVYMSTVSLLFSIAITAVFMVVFFKNRKIEKAIPSYWVFFLLFILADIISYLITIGAVYNMDNDNYFIFAVAVRFLVGFIYPASNIYLFLGARK